MSPRDAASQSRASAAAPHAPSRAGKGSGSCGRGARAAENAPLGGAEATQIGSSDRGVGPVGRAEGSKERPRRAKHRPTVRTAAANRAALANRDLVAALAVDQLTGPRVGRDGPAEVVVVHLLHLGGIGALGDENALHAGRLPAGVAGRRRCRGSAPRAAGRRRPPRSAATSDRSKSESANAASQRPPCRSPSWCRLCCSTGPPATSGTRTSGPTPSQAPHPRQLRLDTQRFRPTLHPRPFRRMRSTFQPVSRSTTLNIACRRAASIAMSTSAYQRSSGSARQSRTSESRVASTTMSMPCVERTSPHRELATDPATIHGISDASSASPTARKTDPTLTAPLPGRPR